MQSNESTLPPTRGQHFDFTCGPACLNFVLSRQNDVIESLAISEIRLWQEANTAFMGRGYPGCCGEGLALAASKRGAPVTLYRSDPPFVFSAILRNETRRNVVEALTSQYESDARAAGVTFVSGEFDFLYFDQMLGRGAKALVLVQMRYRDMGRGSHWIVVTGIEAGRYRIWDPYGMQGPNGDSVTLTFQPQKLRNIFITRHHFCVVFIE
jgi:Peptidase_C39 like family